MKKRTTLAKAVSVVLVLLWSATAAAQFSKAEDAVDYRQAAFTLMVAHFGRMQPIVKGQAAYDPVAIKTNVDLLMTLSTLPWAAFAAGTQGGNARPEIWSEASDFKQKQDQFQDKMRKLSAAANAGELDQLRVAFGEVGASCKACHDGYRKKKK
jgi:cytochrome c556